MNDYYLEIILEDKIYSQRTPHSKFVEFDLNGAKQNTYEELPFEVKRIIDNNKKVEENPKEFFEYKIRNNEVVITKLLKTIEPFFKIPSHIDGYPVTELATRFASHSPISVNQIQLPHTLKRLNEYTFQALNVNYINLPSSIKIIPIKCFYDSAIKSINLSNVTYICENAFSYCDKLKTIDLSNVEQIDSGAFSHCTSLESAILSDKFKHIPEYLFYECYKLKNIKISKNVEKIGKFAFTKTLIKNIDFPSSLKSIGAYAFNGCKELTKFHAPANLNSIECCAFEGCEKLNDVKLNNNIKKIFASAFEKTNISSVKIPKDTSYYSNSFPENTSIIIQSENNIER